MVLCSHDIREPREALEQGWGGVQVCWARSTCFLGTGHRPTICLGEAQTAYGPGLSSEPSVC